MSNLDLVKAEPEERALPDGSQRSDSSEQPAKARQRGKTVSLVESHAAQGERDSTGTKLDDEAETNPVEWIMVTRSDPGGSVPRFMVERGTPGSIVADASKFLDWACKKEHGALPLEPEGTKTSDTKGSTAEDLVAYQTNGHLAGVDGSSSNDNEPPEEAAEVPQGMFANLATMAKSGVESYAPQAILDQLHHDVKLSPIEPVDAVRETDDASSISSTTFASAEEAFEEDDASANSTLPPSISRTTESIDQSPYVKELAKLHDRKKVLDQKLARSREKEVKDKEELTSKEQDRLRKADEKHKREVEKQEEKYKKEVAKLEAKRAKEAAKEEERRKRELDKDEKARLAREKEELRQELEMIKKERDIFRDRVGALQRENTSLVARLGKISEGRSVLKDVQAEIAGGSRSRSSSIRRSKERSETGRGLEATILAGDPMDK